MKVFSKVSILGVLIAAATIGGCQKIEQPSADTASSTENSAVKTLSIGFQKSSLNLLVARQQKLFEQAFPNAKIEWREFPSQLLVEECRCASSCRHYTRIKVCEC